MLTIYDYRCDSTEEIFERLVERGTDVVFCNCGNPAKRLISPVRCKLDHSFPGEGIKWAKTHEKEAKRGMDKG